MRTNRESFVRTKDKKRPKKKFTVIKLPVVIKDTCTHTHTMDKKINKNKKKLNKKSQHTQSLINKFPLVLVVNQSEEIHD